MVHGKDKEKELHGPFISKLGSTLFSLPKLSVMMKTWHEISHSVVPLCRARYKTHVWLSTTIIWCLGTVWFYMGAVFSNTSFSWRRIILPAVPHQKSTLLLLQLLCSRTTLPETANFWLPNTVNSDMTSKLAPASDIQNKWNVPFSLQGSLPNSQPQPPGFMRTPNYIVSCIYM